MKIYVFLNTKGIGIEIERKTYLLFIGIGRPFHKYNTAFYIFDGWIDEQTKRRFQASLTVLGEEAGAGRVTPTLTEAGIFDIGTPSESDNRGTLLGSIIKVLYSNRYSNPQKIEKFFTESKVAVHRAEPINKPTKTVGELLREKFTRL